MKKPFIFKKHHLYIGLKILAGLLIFVSIFIFYTERTQASSGRIDVTPINSLSQPASTFEVGETMGVSARLIYECSQCGNGHSNPMSVSDWGDGTGGGGRWHSYNTPGTYTISVYGSYSCQEYSLPWGCGYGNEYNIWGRATITVNSQQPPGPFDATVTANCKTGADNNKPINNLSWSNSSRAQYYGVYRKSDIENRFILKAYVPNTITNYNDGNINSATVYQYQIVAFSMAGLTTGSNSGNPITIMARNCFIEAGFRVVGELFTGENLTFFGNAEDYGGGTITSYQWNFGDGTSGSGQNVTHSYSSAGQKTVTLTVTSSRENLTFSTSATLNIAQRVPVLSIFKTLLIGNTISLTTRNSITIQYDSQTAKNPPPGFSELLAPLWREVSP